MSKEIDGGQIRRILLEVINEMAERGLGFFQAGAILNEASKRLGSRGLNLNRHC